jgi:hypothetical protein
MKTAIMGLLGSKKFWMTILGCVVLAVSDHLGIPQDKVIYIASLFGVQIGGQALADHGKEAARVEADASAAVDAAIAGKSPAEAAASLSG